MINEGDRRFSRPAIGMVDLALEDIVPKEIPDFEFDYENAEKQSSWFNFHRITHNMLDRKIVSNKIDLDLPDNSIQTNKYTKWNFLPKNLLDQFSKKANIYFLFIGIMQTIPYITISNGLPAIFLPLAAILLITALKDFFEDYKRKISDMAENSRAISVYENGEFIEKKWKDLRVGNIIELKQNEYIPADILLLWASEPKGNCYIETKNLDGETNLKTKTAKKEISKYFNDKTKLDEKKIIFDYERPTQYLYTFQGHAVDVEGNKIKTDNNNFLLRGCSLKNTKSILGLVAYTGHQTKIMLNSFKARAKRSKVEKIMGKQIVIIFIIQSLLCFFCSIFYLVWYIEKYNELEYLSILPGSVVDNENAYNFFVRYGNWTLIFTNFVPISLLVTLEMVKFIQGYFIFYDEDMKYKYNKEPPKIINNVNDTKDSKDLMQPQKEKDAAETLIENTTVQSSNLNEELGQIEYIFSDKTGTLTCNIMDFKKISIAGVSYGDYESEKDELYITNYDNYPKVTNVDFRSRKILNEFENTNSIEYEHIKDCLFFLAICHTVVTEQKSDELIYNSSSPDEMALVNFAKFCGVEFKGIDEDNFILVEYKSEIYKYKLLETLEFTSERKRQSVIVQDQDQTIYLYCKGADSTLKNKIITNEMNKSIKEKTWDHLSDYGRIGLRTLVLARRKLDQSTYINWEKRYQSAQLMKENKMETLMNLQDEIEEELEIIGATAIEDKLQREVTETIQALKEAGIKVWVLTGDKIDTAINIGYSCGLLNNFMVKHIVNEDKENELDQKLQNILKVVEEDEKENKSNYNALIIHGDSLLQMIKPFIKNNLQKITEKCQAVLCCRVSPKQKQEIVTFVRQGHPNVSTLAIGDGANDVNMITAAHVGVGIRGVEGQQAARSSDYAIGEFRLLRRLLFYHGRECYRRNSYLVLFNFFKNICLVLPQFWYGVTNNFSGQTLYDSYIYQMFNIFYASLPIIIYAIFDKELSSSILVENKINYYEQGIKSNLFNTLIFWTWFFFGAWQSIILVFFCFYSLESNFVDDHGRTMFFWASGTMVFGMCVVVVNIKVLIFSNTHNFLSLAMIIGSLATYLLSLAISNYVSTNETYLLYFYLMHTSNFHFGNFICICGTCLMDFSFEIYNQFKQRIYLVNKKIELQNLLSKHKERLEKLKNTERVDSGGNPDEVLNLNSMANNYTIIREKENKTFANVSKSIFMGTLMWPGKLSKRDNTINAELTGIFVKNIEKHNGFAFSQDDTLFPRHMNDQ